MRPALEKLMTKLEEIEDAALKKLDDKFNKKTQNGVPRPPIKPLDNTAQIN